MASQIVAYSGFSSSNYIREAYSSDLDFGTGEWSASAWVNVPVSLPTNNLPTNGVNLLPNNGLFYDTDANNIPDGWLSSPAGSKIEYAGNKFALTLTGVNGVSYIANTLSLTIGKVYKISAYIEPNTGNPYFGVGTSNVVSVTRSVANGPGYATTYFVATESTPYLRASNTNSATYNIANYISELKVEEVIDLPILSRSYSSGAKIDLTVNYFGRLGATVFDGTTPRTAITPVAYNTGSWLKVETNYRAGRLSININGQEVAVTNGAPLLTLNNSNAVLTIGNSYDLTAPFPGSLALLKLSATVPTPEQSLWMYEQEKQMFRDNAQITLPDSTAINDLAYDDQTDRWIAISNTNKSTWNGLVRVASESVSAGSFSKTIAGSGIQLSARITTDPGVDITIPAYNIKSKIKKKAEKSKSLSNSVTVYDFTPVVFTNATLTNGSNIMTCSTVSGTPYIGMGITGTGISAGMTIIGINGTSYYLSANYTGTTGSAYTVGQSTFTLPTGYTSQLVYSNGTLQREGSTKSYTRAFDGFRETVSFLTSPGTSVVQIHAIRA